MSSNFQPAPFKTVNATATTSAASVLLGSRPQSVRIYNAGATPVFIEFGGSAGPAASIATSMPLLPTAVEVFEKGLSDYVSVITGSGTALVYFTLGDGQ